MNAVNPEWLSVHQTLRLHIKCHSYTYNITTL